MVLECSTRNRIAEILDFAQPYLERLFKGAVWCMKFSHCGRLLATSGQDNVIWVWVLKEFYNYFNDMRIKYDSRGMAACDFSRLIRRLIWDSCRRRGSGAARYDAASPGVFQQRRRVFESCSKRGTHRDG